MNSNLYKHSASQHGRTVDKNIYNRYEMKSEKPKDYRQLLQKKEEIQQHKNVGQTARKGINVSSAQTNGKINEQFKMTESKEKEQQKNNTTQKGYIEWLTHFYLPVSSILDKRKKILQIIHDNYQIFKKAIIYCNFPFDCRDFFNNIPQKLKPVLILKQYSQQDKKKRYIDFILEQHRVLITDMQPDILFENAMIDIEDVDLIINEELPSSPQIYLKRVTRSNKLNQQHKGVVINLVQKSYTNHFGGRSYACTDDTKLKELGQKLHKQQIKFIQHYIGMDIKRYFNERKYNYGQNFTPKNEKTIKQAYGQRKFSSNIGMNNQNKKDMYRHVQNFNSKNNYDAIADKVSQSIKDDKLELDNKNIQLSIRDNNKRTDSNRCGNFDYLKQGQRKQSQSPQQYYGKKSQESSFKKLDGELSEKSSQSNTYMNPKIQNKLQQEEEVSDRKKDQKGWLNSTQQKPKQTSSKNENELQSKMQQKFNQILFKIQSNEKMLMGIKITNEELKQNNKLIQNMPQKISDLIRAQIKSNRDEIKEMNEKIGYIYEQFPKQLKDMKSLINQLLYKIENFDNSKQQLSIKTGQYQRLQIEKQDEQRKYKELISKFEDISSISSHIDQKLEKHLSEQKQIFNQTKNIFGNKMQQLKQQLNANYIKQIQNLKGELKNYGNEEKISKKQHEDEIRSLKDYYLKKIQQDNINNYRLSKSFQEEQNEKIKIQMKKPSRETKSVDKVKEHTKYQRQEKEKEINAFLKSLNKVINTNYNTDLNISMENYQEKLSILNNLLTAKVEKPSFLAQSVLYEKLNAQQKAFLFDSIMSITTKPIIKTKTLFQGQEGLPFQGWLMKIQGKHNLLTLLELQNGFFVAGFSEDAFYAQKPANACGDAILMSLTNMKKYQLKPSKKGYGIRCHTQLFGMGNGDLLITHKRTFNVMVESIYCDFNFMGDKTINLIGQSNDEGKYIRLEFHQIITEK